MRNLLFASVAVAGLAMVASSAGAGTWVAAVPVQNSTSTTVFGITDQNIIAGAYVDSGGVTHGFFGPFDGSNYTSFDDPGGTTEPRAINDKGYITGYDVATVVPWERYLDGSINTVKKHAALNQLAQGINKSGVFAGNYFDKNGVSVGYLGKKADFVSKIKLSINNSGVAGRAINNAGDVGGWYYDSNIVQHGYVIIGGTATSIDFPSAAYTVVEGLNDKGIASGQYQDSNGVIHGFIYKLSSGKFISLDPPGSTLTQVWGISNKDVVAASSSLGSFVYCIKAKTCPAAGADVVEKEISVPLKSMPHYPCVNDCRTPLALDAADVGSWMAHAPKHAPGKFAPELQ